MAYARGIDISHHQGTFDWARAKSQHALTFGIAKASEGQGWRDGQFKRNWQQIKANGLVRGAYHFARPAGDVTANVDNFLGAIKDAGGLEPDDLLVLDIEVTDSVASADIGAWCRRWCELVAERTNRLPIVYTGYWFIEGADRPARAQGLGNYPLWIAYWPSRDVWWPATQTPRVPEPWLSARTGWLMWQHSDSNNALDLDVFNGSPSELRAFADNQTTTTTGDDGMLPCKYGDRSEAVEYWQRVLAQLGYYKGSYDGIYGDGMKSAVDAYRKTLGLGTDTRVSPYVAMKAHQALFSVPGPKGDKGEKGDPGFPGSPGRDGIDGIDGRDGRDGIDGKTPTKIAVALVGDVIETA